MDPKVCWKALEEACADGQMNEAADRAEDLANWFHKGGFRPREIPGAVDKETLMAFALVCRAVA